MLKHLEVKFFLKYYIRFAKNFSDIVGYVYLYTSNTWISLLRTFAVQSCEY